ncbi:glycoside hydrolase family 15 protein [soil metagenome]
MRVDGTVPIAAYSAVGDGCAVALGALDGSMDWWSVRALDGSVVFDRLLDAENGGYWEIAPAEPASVERRYRPHSNVLETTFRTAGGSARLTESLNSGPAGRLPWAELARRIESLEGTMQWAMTFRPTTQGGAVTPKRSASDSGFMFQIADVLAILLCPAAVEVEAIEREGVAARFSISAGDRLSFAVVATQGEPLVVPKLRDIDARIDGSDREWRQWADALDFDIEFQEQVVRAALTLKFLIFSPTGAIAAAATTSLPESIGGDGNWDYRFAWVRDCAYSINAFLHVGALPEATAAFTWLLKTVRRHGPIRPCYTLSGERVPAEQHLKLPGYAGSQPVRRGNLATGQFQLSLFGDLFDMTWRMVKAGHRLDEPTRQQMFDLADECANVWTRKDSGFWELQSVEHYTISKIECWSALGHACDLVERGQLPDDHLRRWRRERERILDWINANCWSDERQAYVYFAGSDQLDAAILLAPRFGFGLEGRERDRFVLTRSAIEAELDAGDGLVYRFSGAAQKEGAFIAT